MDDEEAMTDEKKPQRDNEPTEKTPGGLEVRTPTRGEFFSNLKKVSKPEK